MQTLAFSCNPCILPEVEAFREERRGARGLRLCQGALSPACPTQGPRSSCPAGTFHRSEGRWTMHRSELTSRPIYHRGSLLSPIATSYQPTACPVGALTYVGSGTGDRDSGQDRLEGCWLSVCSSAVLLNWRMWWSVLGKTLHSPACL